jgi:hypothetical protein
MRRASIVQNSCCLCFSCFFQQKKSFCVVALQKKKQNKKLYSLRRQTNCFFCSGEDTMLDAYERQSVALALLPLVLGEQLGQGQNTATFALANDRKKVVKVFRKFALRDVDYEQQLSRDGLAPKIYASKSVGLLDALLVERVVPLTDLSDLSKMDTEQVLSLCFRLPREFGLVNWNFDQVKSLAKKREGIDPSICMLDTGRCHEFSTLSRVLTEEEKLWAAALHCGLCCLQPAQVSVKQLVTGTGPTGALFQAYASVLLQGRPRVHIGEQQSMKSLEAHTRAKQAALVPITEDTCAKMSYKDVLEEACLTIASVLTAKTGEEYQGAKARLASLKACAFQL